MDQPTGFELAGEEHKVCKLRRSIYGLKQASRQWNLKFNQVVLQNGFEVVEEDHCVYVKRSKKSFLILSLYVDDIMLAGNDKSLIESTKEWLSSTFDMKDMGEASHILGMCIHQDRLKKMLYLSQEEYIDKVLQCFNMIGGKALMTPLPSYAKLSKLDCPQSDEERAKMEKLPYASICGSLMYSLIATHLDIAFVVGVVSIYMSNLGEKHWQVVKGIMRYLSHTKSMRLCYGIQDLSVKGYTNSNYAGDFDKWRSTSGYVFMLARGAVS